MINPNEDILARIREALKNHEEAYDEGAWERFNNTQTTTPAAKTTKTISLWKWGMAAAAVMTAVFFAARVFNTGISNRKHSVEENITAIQQKDSATNIADLIPDNSAQSTTPVVKEKSNNSTNYPNTHRYFANHKQAVLFNENNTNASTIIYAQPQVFQKNIDTDSAQKSVNPNTENQQPQVAAVDFWKPKAEANPPSSVYKEYKNQMAVSPASRNKTVVEKNNKWDPSLYVSPIFGDQGINMGYGISMGYAINDKIKISSGIAHARLSASRNLGTPPPGVAAGAMRPSGAAAKEGSNLKALTTFNEISTSQINFLQQVDGSLSGIDIPVEINYNISKKIYASAGVSGMVVLKDNKKYTYIDQHDVKVSVETDRGSLKEAKSVTFSDQNTTNQPIESPTESTPFLGFYNLSMGYRQKISGKTGVSLEPFLKVPMKNVTRENLRYTGTGIRLRFDF